MEQILSSFLEQNTTPEVKDSIINSFDTFDIIGAENYEDQYIELLMTEEIYDTGTLLSKIIQLTLDYQKDILREHGITLINTVSISVCDKIIDAILGIQDYSDRKAITKILDTPVIANEVFAELINLITGESIDSILSYIENVNDSFIGKAKEYFSDSENLIPEEEFAQRKIYIDLLKKFIDKTNSKLKLVMNLSNGLDVGFPMSVYLSFIGRDIEAMKDDEAARELVAMAYISSDGYTNPISIISNNIDNYVADLDKITRISIEVNKYVLLMQGSNE